MQKLNDVLSLIDSHFGGSQWFVFFLLGTGFFFTLYLKFPQIRFFKHAVQVVSGKFDKKHHIGDTSHFQSLATALSGTVGTGNIAGVALAIHLGGPSALFWMLVTAFLGMTTKMVEVSLSHKYREQTEDGTISGGPMYYMKNRLNMKWMAGIFAVATIFSSFGTGVLPQSNSIANAMHSAFGIPHYIVGGILSVFLGLIIIGGIKRIARVTEKLVPFMGIIYILGALSVLLFNWQNLLPAFISIFSHIFSGSAATGGFLGATVVLAFNRGVNRGLFSNEAGQGSAPIAHAAAKTEEPVSEGMVALLEPFIDTIIVCLLTGLVLLSTGSWQEKYDNKFQQADIMILAGSYDESLPEDKQLVSDGLTRKNILPLYSGSIEVVDGLIVTENITLLHARSFAEQVKVREGNAFFTGSLSVKNGNVNLSEKNNSVYLTGRSLLHSAPLSSKAFKQGFFGHWGEYIVPLSLLLFAFSTAIAWSYYGDRAIIYLGGRKYVRIYHFLYILGFFLASFTDTTIIWAFTGITVALMTLPNLIGILLLHKEVKTSINTYWIKKKKNDLN